MYAKIIRSDGETEVHGIISYSYQMIRSKDDYVIELNLKCSESISVNTLNSISLTVRGSGGVERVFIMNNEGKTIDRLQ